LLPASFRTFLWKCVFLLQNKLCKIERKKNKKALPKQGFQFVEKVFSTNCEWKSAKAVFHSIHHIYCKNGFPAL